ncbi:MAG: hypothetical protein LUE98_01955 [Tannerellaceae bacterium]|nr:hypothetical protein [Tannerellaceae bacterium]
MTKEFLKQIPLKHFIQHVSPDYDWLLPGIRYWEDIEGGTGTNMDFILNGNLIGYMNLNMESDLWVEGYIRDSHRSGSKFYLNHIEKNYYHILFVDKEGDLCRSYISDEQAVDAGLELRRFYVL